CDGSRIAVDGAGCRTYIQRCNVRCTRQAKAVLDEMRLVAVRAGSGYKLEGRGSGAVQRGRAKDMYIRAMWRGGIAEVDLPGGYRGSADSHLRGKEHRGSRSDARDRRPSRRHTQCGRRGGQKTPQRDRAGNAGFVLALRGKTCLS